MSARLELAAYLRNICLVTEGLERVRVVDSVRAIDDLSRPVLVVKTDNYTRVPEQPTKIAGNFTIVAVSSHVDIDKAEAELEDIVELLLPMLYTAQLLFGSATQTEYDNARLSYDITVMSLLT